MQQFQARGWDWNTLRFWISPLSIFLSEICGDTKLIVSFYCHKYRFGTFLALIFSFHSRILSNEIAEWPIFLGGMSAILAFVKPHFCRIWNDNSTMLSSGNKIIWIMYQSRLSYEKMNRFYERNANQYHKWPIREI